MTLIEPRPQTWCTPDPQRYGNVAHGNFTLESAPVQNIPVQSDVYVEKKHSTTQAEQPAREEDHTHMAVIIGILMAVIILLAGAIFLIVSRHRKRKCFASPLASKQALPGTNNHQHLPPGSGCGTAEKGATMGSYIAKEVDDNYNQSRGIPGTMASTTMTTLPPPPPPGDKSAMLLMDHGVDIKLDDYQEPYQALKYAPYYSYSTVIMEMRDMLNKCSAAQSDTSYDYAVPEMGMPLLSPETTLPVPMISSTTSDKDSVFSKGSSSKGSKSEDSKGKKSPSQQEVLNALKRRLEQTAVPEFPSHRLRMVSKLAEGAFGTVYVAEADGILEYGMAASLGKRLVAVKFLLHDASEKENDRGISVNQEAQLNSRKAELLFPKDVSLSECRNLAAHGGGKKLKLKARVRARALSPSCGWMCKERLMMLSRERRRCSKKTKRT
uniref:(California timema) hypothetical protein n=1 Tax=Timema californicum TaxID=61474 RepID=A0A7R9P5F8_TIMCA|nr:unnamed protein product [Timema californicum]